MNKRHMCGFLFGFSVGASIALLFAPRPGKRIRARIAESAADGVSYVKQYGETVRDTTRGFVERGKEEITRQKDGVAEGIKRGTEAYQDAVR